MLNLVQEVKKKICTSLAQDVLHIVENKKRLWVLDHQHERFQRKVSEEMVHFVWICIQYEFEMINKVVKKNEE